MEEPTDLALPPSVVGVGEFPGDPSSVAAARGFLRALFPESEAIEVAALLVSELAANAVRHAHTGFEVKVIVDNNLRVEISDGSAILPTIRTDDDINSIGGRGLRIVDVCSLRWGSEHRGTGKVIWFELAYPDESAPNSAT